MKDMFIALVYRPFKSKPHILPYSSLFTFVITAINRISGIFIVHKYIASQALEKEWGRGGADKL